MATSKAEVGNRIFAVSSSMMPNTGCPEKIMKSNGWKSAWLLKERLAQPPIRKASPPRTVVTSQRGLLKRPIAQLTEASSKATELVRAAKNTMMKNNRPISDPAGIVWKATGRLTNSSPSPPCTCSCPLRMASRLTGASAAKVIGNIARPAITATDVSAVAIWTDVLARLISRPA